MITHTEFNVLLARARVSQAEFARLTGNTPEAVNNWCKGRRPTPQWAVVLTIVLAERQVRPWDARAMLKALKFQWFETLGVSVEAPLKDISSARAKLAKLHHSDTGGSHEVMVRINHAFDTAKLLRR